MFVWRKRAGASWLAANEVGLREIAGQRLAIVSKPQSKNAIAEIAGKNRSDLESIRSRFGGTIEKLPRNWLGKFLRGKKSRPLKIGKRLVIDSSRRSTKNKTLVIPAGMAFGTGEHVTTAMSLRMLERLTRFWGVQAASVQSSAARRRNKSSEKVSAGSRNKQAGSLRSAEKEFSLLDLGTGAGILALAAARFGAKRTIAIDHDPLAIATAKENARRNEIEQVDFRVADVRRWQFPAKVDLITANLFSELLIEILPKLKCADWLILSGVLREQESQLFRALKRNRIAAIEIRRRGKWITILAQPIQGHPGRKRQTSPILVARTM
ncbi:MAG TPA: 50S ribosomal protein L11 methyltransferase [Chthoniobacterales bacterium]|nr:50S ribosomal protein L11 methyltransferase [Chthoniobacterales bacterium]